MLSVQPTNSTICSRPPGADRGAETNDRSLTQWSPGFYAIGAGLRQQIADDADYVAVVGQVLDGLYRFCQEQLAPVAAKGPRPA